MKRIFYLGLEPLKSRYTYQLCKEWFPTAIAESSKQVEFIDIPGDTVPDDIEIGTVLDATGRGIYAMSQVKKLLAYIRLGDVRSDDVIFLQDFWTPGFESVQYALDLHGIKGVKVYSMLHAQSVDEYDFTNPMARWMRPFELGMDELHSAIFVGSTIHREQLRAAGFRSPIHVVGLPISRNHVSKQMKMLGGFEKTNNVIFTSRLDREKNPYFMVKCALAFLDAMPEWTFTITTSGNSFRSNDPSFVPYLYKVAEQNDRFILLPGISKGRYYEELLRSKIQFNTSLQDYVSWTLLEAIEADCDLVYPDFRSFTECVPHGNRFTPFVVDDAVRLLIKTAQAPYNENREAQLDTVDKCAIGRMLQADIVTGRRSDNMEVNVWHHQH